MKPRSGAGRAQESAKSDLHREMLRLAQELGGFRFEEADGGRRMLCFGHPSVATRGAMHYMCVAEDQIRRAMLNGVDAIRREVAEFGSDTTKARQAPEHSFPPRCPLLTSLARTDTGMP